MELKLLYVPVVHTCKCMSTFNHVPVKFAHMNGHWKAYDISSVFRRYETTVYFRPFLYLFYEYFCVLRVKMEGFECFSSILVMFMVEKDNFHMTFHLENVTVIFI